MTVIEVFDQAWDWTSQLVGRDQDLAVLRALVDEIPAHSGGGAMLLSGEPGDRKSALLDVMAEIAAMTGFRVLRAAGAEYEDVSFSELNQLLLPLRAGLGRLNGVQRSALEMALGFTVGSAGNRLVVSNAALAPLLAAAADRPLPLIEDDLPWVDRASAQVLGFVARRLRGSPVGLIAAERSGAARSSDLGLHGYEVQPLDDDASPRLAAARFPELVPSFRRRIVNEARGSSLTLLEPPAQLSERQQPAPTPLPTILPLSGRFRAAVLELSVSGDMPRVHLALAAGLRDQPEPGVWNLARAAVHPAGEVAGRGLLEQVARQPPGAGDASQARRLVTAAYRAASVVGDLSAAQVLFADARRAYPDSVSSAETALATAFVLLHGDGDVATAHRLLLRGLEAAHDGGTGPLTLEESLWSLVTVCRLSGRAEHWESLERLLAGSGSAFSANVLAGVGGALNPRAALGRLDWEIESLAGQAESAEIVRIAGAVAFADGLPGCRQALREVMHREPDGSVGTPAMEAGILLALGAYQTGQWDEAWRLAEAAAGQCASRGYQLLRRQAQTVLALVAACRGDADAAQALADEIVRWAAPRGITSLLAGAQYAYVLVALAQSDFTAAYHQAAKISPAGLICAREPFAAWALLDLIEAALRTDRPGEAAAHVQAVRQAGLAGVSSRLALLSTAAMAMTAGDDEAPALFDRALASEDAERWPFDRARVHLLAGERLRRLREVTAARVHLRTAHDEFRRLGAWTWADRAATALRATGQAPRRADRPGHQLLTPQELEIAQLAAAGLTNKQIAGRLFISHRTVASHLLRIFPKLGITSRAALGRALPRDGD